MRRPIISIAFMLAGTLYLQPAFAQKDSIQLKDLAMPASPAFSLLDQAPSVVDRPSSARAFTLGLFQSIDQKTGLPTNYSAEFTPFWFYKHKNMSVYKFYGTDDKGTELVSYPWQLIPRSAISVAFVNPVNSTTSGTATPTNSTLSGGLRVPLFKVLRKTDVDALIREVTEVTIMLKGFNEKLDEDHPNATSLATTDPEAYKKLMDKFVLEYAAYKKAYEENHKPGDKEKAKVNVADVLSRRPAVALDLAGAQSWYFPNQTFDSNRAGRTGVWLTLNAAAGFKQNATAAQKGYFSVYLIGRYMTDRTLANTAVANTYLDIDYLDGGGKLELELSRVSFSYEAVWRNVNGADQDKNPTVGSGWRSVGNIKYRIADSTFITGAFGKNFGIRDNLLYALGINWNIQTGTEQAVAQ